MAESSEGLEGWTVAQRRGFIAAVLTPLVLALCVVGAARLYDRYLRPQHRQPIATFPAPGVETYIHDGVGDPKRTPRRAAADPALAAAKRAVVAAGLPNWTAR
jgi:hypothetical protein